MCPELNKTVVFITYKNEKLNSIYQKHYSNIIGLKYISTMPLCTVRINK